MKSSFIVDATLEQIRAALTVAGWLPPEMRDRKKRPDRTRELAAAKREGHEQGDDREDQREGEERDGVGVEAHSLKSF